MERAVSRETIEAFGGEATLRAAIDRYQRQLADHVGTENQPAPSAHPLVDEIVRYYDGAITIVEPVKNPDIVAPTDPELVGDVERLKGDMEIVQARLAVLEPEVGKHRAEIDYHLERITTLETAVLELKAEIELLKNQPR
jgi:hypothetical protein